jgi:UTP-glucose-1-phosphate uridylyltransferase
MLSNCLVGGIIHEYTTVTSNLVSGLGTAVVIGTGYVNDLYSIVALADLIVITPIMRRAGQQCTESTSSAERGNSKQLLRQLTPAFMTTL